MKKLLATLWVCLALTACTATDALKLATSTLAPEKGPELTVQAGAENSKQHLGLQSKVDSSVSVEKVHGPVTVRAEKKPQALQSEAVQAENITFNQTEIWPLVIAFLSGLIPSTALLFWTLPRPKWCRKEEPT